MGSWVLKKGKKRASTRTGKREEKCHELFGANNESSWLLLIFVEFLGALGKVVCLGWEVSPHLGAVLEAWSWL